jgi:hypothetical protein
MPATSKAGRIRRAAGLPVDAKAVRAIQASGENEAETIRAAIVQKVLSRQGQILDGLKAQLLEAGPEAMTTVMLFATRQHGTPSLQLDAAKWLLDRVGAGINPAGDGCPLQELPLDQLESVLSASLESTRQLRSIASTSQRIDSVEESVPTSGTDAEPS